MPNYLICDNCQHKNVVNSERIVFCKQCQKKIANNFLDWKKTKFNSSFETYVDGLNDYNESIPLKTNVEENTEKKKKIFKSSLSSPSKKSIIFIASLFIQLVLVAFLLNNQNFENISNDKKSNANYLKEVKWVNYPITQNLSLTLPFELKESNSILPCYMHNYIDNDKCNKAESSQSFSVTIEKMKFNSYLNIENADLISINDEYMQTPGVEILKEEGLHLMLRDYKTYVEYGSYLLNGNEYLYENYTLTKGNEGVKIVLSYLKNDKILCQYADIVTKSLLKNIPII
jgi:hypothetical protein